MYLITYLIRYVNVLKKTNKKTLITYQKPTYLWCFSPDPKFVRHVIGDAWSTKTKKKPFTTLPISAKRGADSKFVAEANHILLVPKSKPSSIPIYQIGVRMNAEF